MNQIIPKERIEKSIYLIRGHKVMFDTDLANLYEVPIGALNRAVKRNAERFPDDFCFQLSQQEYDSLRCHLGILKEGRGQHRKYRPFAFTEQGVAMLSSVLKSKRAILVNVQIIRTFVQLRQILASNKALAKRMAALEQKSAEHDDQLEEVFDAIRQLMEPLPSKNRKIGFISDD